MQFNDDTDLPDPGDHVVLNDEDFGSATYDSDHDGIADSVIVGQQDYSIVITDSDHDGEADSVKAYDQQGNQVDPRTGAAVGDGAGTGGDDGSGDSTAGDSGTEGQTDPTSHTTGTDDGQPDADQGSTTETSSGTEGRTGDSSGTEPTGDQGDGGSGDGTTSDGGITVIGDDGTPVTVGQPTADLNGDGTADTAVVQNHDGSTTGYTDVDGDGHADQITQINADGSVVIAVSDGDGHWQVESTGHLDPDGKYVEDPKTGDREPDAPATDGTAADGNSDIESSTTITFTTADGQAYPLGPPTADLSGDGRLDTVVNQLPDGTVVGYSDIDGDGQADQVTQIDPDGAVTIGVPDGSGGWEQAATGRIGDGGEFVPDSDGRGSDVAGGTVPVAG